MPTLNSICDIPATLESDYLVLAYLPGAGNPLYAGRENEWTTLKFKGCTKDLEGHIEALSAYKARNIAMRVISTMSDEDEKTARKNRAFKTPDNTPEFCVVTDPDGKYEKYCDNRCKRMAIGSGEFLYPAHTMIFKKMKFDSDINVWTGLCIAVLKRGDDPKQTVIEAIDAHNAKISIAANQNIKDGNDDDKDDDRDNRKRMKMNK
ncbi:MAG: hypothetical protein ACHQAX_03005 [Gammaproteobacteria bacterium]